MQRLFIAIFLIFRRLKKLLKTLFFCRLNLFFSLKITNYYIVIMVLKLFPLSPPYNTFSTSNELRYRSTLISISLCEICAI